eukprot:3346470-Prymnesium_polylepis.2
MPCDVAQHRCVAHSWSVWKARRDRTPPYSFGLRFAPCTAATHPGAPAAQLGHSHTACPTHTCTRARHAIARPEVDAVGAGVGAPHAQLPEHVRERELVALGE